MTRILTYNILVGGARRVEQITQMIRAAHPDVVGLVEASSMRVVEELAERLGMQYCMNETAAQQADGQVALLSRLPLLSSHIHARSGGLAKPLLEACIQEENGQTLTVYVTHLEAAFRHWRGGDYMRQREIREILRIMRQKQGAPHLLIGDFNSLTPGEALKGSRLLRYLVEQDERRKQQQDNKGYPVLNFVVPPSLRFLNPMLRSVPRHAWLSAVFDSVCGLYAARGTMHVLQRAGYVDSFRQVHPRAWGFTCPAKAPAGRIDYIMLSPELSGRLAQCDVLAEGNGIEGHQASDHLPLVAELY